MTDLVERLRELCERHTKIPEGPYFVAIDEATDCPPHANSGLSLVDTGRQSDWPIARLCESPMADAISDIPIMLAALLEAATEIERLRADAERQQNNINILQEQVKDLIADNDGPRLDALRYREGAHGNCHGPKGELGMAWCKFDAFGQLESALWVTDQEVDAAIAARASVKGSP